MKILSISSILPIPEDTKNNDFVFQTYVNYRKLYKEDSIVIIRPLKLDLNLFSIIKKILRRPLQEENLSKNLQGFRVEILRFFSSWRFRNIHSIITRSIYHLNKKHISEMLSAGGFDIIHAQFIFPDALLANYIHRNYGIPYVVTTHNEKFYFDHIISRKTSLRVLQQASGIYPINHTNFLNYKKLQLKHVELIPLGFNDSFVRNQKTCNHGQVSILSVCELIPLKNVDKVILAVGQLIGKYNIHYTVIGRGIQKNYLKQLVTSLKLDEFITFIDRIPYEEIAEEIYRHDIFIMPSFFETFGRVYFEAMAMGIPVICAKYSGIYGIFKEYDEGISVDHRNIPEIVSALKFLITNPEERQRIGSNGKKLVEQYTWTHIAEKLHNKYEEIIHL